MAVAPGPDLTSGWAPALGNLVPEPYPPAGKKTTPGSQQTHSQPCQDPAYPPAGTHHLGMPRALALANSRPTAAPGHPEPLSQPCQDLAIKYDVKNNKC